MVDIVTQVICLSASTVPSSELQGPRGQSAAGAAAKGLPIVAQKWTQGGVRKRLAGRVVTILAASGLALLLPKTAEGSRPDLFNLPAELSYIGYLNVKHRGIWVSVPDIEQRFQVGDRFSLVQRNRDYYIAVDDREDQPRRLFAVRRKLNDGRGTAWVTKQKDLIFGNLTGTEPGIFYLQLGDLLPIVVEEQEYYVVLCERNGVVFELSVPKALQGVQFVQHLPKPIAWYDEKMRLQVVLTQPFRRGGNSPSETTSPSPPFQAKQSHSQWTASSARPPTDPAAEAADGASRSGAATLPQPGSPKDSLPPPAVSAPTSVSTPSTPLTASHPPAAEASPAESVSLAALARVPQRIPQSLPIDWIGTSEFIAELSRAMRQRAVQSLSATQHEPPKHPTSIGTAATKTESADTVEVATDAQDEGQLALPESSAILSGDVSPTEPPEAAELPHPEVALMGNPSAPSPTSQLRVVTRGGAATAERIGSTVIALATIIPLLILIIIAMLVNRRPQTQ
jgi:hypothetical protein